MIFQTVCLLLLTCLAGILANEGDQDGAVKDLSSSGPYSMAISGVNTVTVGVPYAFFCSASCQPACTFSWTNGDRTTTGQELTLQLKERRPQVVLTCMAINPATGKTSSMNKTLVVTEGPSNMKIGGPTMLTVGVENIFTCTADCYPSCTYIWRWLVQGKGQTSVGPTLSIIPPETVDSETIVCEAMDTVSHLYISTSVQLYAARIGDIYITSPSGDWTVTVGQFYDYICFVECTPSCTYNWTFEGKTYHNDLVHLPVFHKGEKPMVKEVQQITIMQGHHTEPLTCTARNTVSGATISTTEILTIDNPYSVQPATQAKPIAGDTFSLQCIGSQNPTTLSWLKNGLPLSASDRLLLSQDNTLLTFSPLQASDTGTYKCVINQGQGNIKSVGYELQVDYGPFKVEIVEVNKGAVGKELTALPGSSTDLQCVADCLPGCSISWFYNGKLLSTDASISFTPVAPPNQAVLRCVASDPLTMKNSSAETTVILPYGPSKVEIVEVNKGAVGKELTALPGSSTDLQCVADCLPGCSISWFYNGKLLSTDASISFTPVAPPNQAVLRCVASDPLTMKNSSAETTVILPYGPFKVQIVEVNKGAVGKELTALPGSSTDLQCVADCLPGCSISWFYNGKLLSTDASISFTPVAPPNQAVLRCVASDPLTMKNSSAETTVILPYGPFKVQIVEVNKGAVGKELTALPGSSTDLQCVADCLPGCSISWFYNGKLLSTDASISFTPVAPPNQAVLRCVASDPLTMKNSSAETTVILPYGPEDVIVSGLSSLEVGVKATFTCNAMCLPPCTYTWSVFGAPAKGSSVDIMVNRYVPTETISCEAWNSVSGQSREVNITFTVSDPHWCGC